MNAGRIELLVPLKRAAERTGVTAGELVSLRTRGAGPWARSISGALFYAISELDEWRTNVALPRWATVGDHARRK